MITRIQVQNFKSLQDVDVQLRPLSLFTGLNGMGKSSLMQVLLLLQQSSSRQLSFQVEGVPLNGSLVSLGNGQDVLSVGSDSNQIAFRIWETRFPDPFVWQLEADPQLDILRIAGVTPPAELAQGFNDAFESVRFSASDREKFQDWMSVFSMRLPFLAGHQTQYLSAERASPLVAYPTSSYEVQQRRQVGKHGEYTAHFLAVHGEEPVAFDNLLYPAAPGAEAAPNTLLRQVGAWLQEISPGLRLDAVEYPDLGLVRLGYAYQTATGYTRSYRPGNVGFGLSYALPVLTAILGAQPGSLLMIENPESHIHPRGQAKLGELLALAAQNDVQLLVETHSDHVLNGVRVAVKKYRLDPERVGICFFERAPEAEGHQTTVLQPRLDQDGRIDIWPRNFFDEWENSLTELL